VRGQWKSCGAGKKPYDPPGACRRLTLTSSKDCVMSPVVLEEHGGGLYYHIGDERLVQSGANFYCGDYGEECGESFEDHYTW